MALMELSAETPRNHTARAGLSILLALLVGVAGVVEINAAKFTDYEASQVRQDALVGRLDQDDTVSQSLVPSRNYFSSLRLFARTSSNRRPGASSYLIWLRLLDSQYRELASGQIEVPSTAQDFDIPFSFPPQANSGGHTYYVLLDTNAPAHTVSLWGSSFDAYPGGSIFLGGQRGSTDLTFWSYYHPPALIWFLQGGVNAWPRLLELAETGFAFAAIGLLACIALGFTARSLFEQVFFSAGVGIAIPPVLLWIIGVLGIRLDPARVWISAVLLALLAGTRLFWTRRRGTVQLLQDRINVEEVLVVGLLLLLAALARVVQIDGLAVPNWVDGVVHQGILTNLVQAQKVSPEAVYPKGFHSNVAFIYYLLGTPLPEGTLALGQWLSVVSGLTVYLLARRVLPFPYAVLSAVLCWFWAPFPAYLIGWARYPYLQGLALWPLAAALLIDKRPGSGLPWAMLALLTMAIGLTYYGAFLLLLAFLCALAYFSVWSREGSRSSRLAPLALAVLPALLVLGLRLTVAVRQGVSGQASASNAVEDLRHVFELSLSHGGWILWILGVLGLVAAALRGAKGLILIASSFLIMVALNAAQGVLGVTISSPANTLIFAYLPLCLLSGYLLSLIPLGARRGAIVARYALLAFIAIAGAYNISGIINPDTLLYRSADQKAMAWIRQNTPAASRFLINSFLWVDTYAPSDGGGWITAETNRPSFYLKSRPEYQNLELVLAGEGADYIYLGLGAGELSPLVDGLPNLSLAYNRDGIRIYEVLP